MGGGTPPLPLGARGHPSNVKNRHIFIFRHRSVDFGKSTYKGQPQGLPLQQPPKSPLSGGLGVPATDGRGNLAPTIGHRGVICTTVTAYGTPITSGFKATGAKDTHVAPLGL